MPKQETNRVALGRWVTTRATYARGEFTATVYLYAGRYEWQVYSTVCPPWEKPKKSGRQKTIPLAKKAAERALKGLMNG